METLNQEAPYSSLDHGKIIVRDSDGDKLVTDNMIDLLIFVRERQVIDVQPV